MKSEQGRSKSPLVAQASCASFFEATRSQRHARETVEFSVKGPIGVSINDEQLSNSGCAVLDLVFAAPSQVGELTLRNYYTMWLSILVKTKFNNSEPGNGLIATLNPGQNKEEVVSDWMMSVPRKLMMPYPHHETGSQDLVSIPCTESVVEWKNLVAMRIILRQPSPVWKTFHIEEINIYKDLPRRVLTKESSTESLMMIIKKQTIAALRWTPTAETANQAYSGGYEFSSLPQP